MVLSGQVGRDWMWYCLVRLIGIDVVYLVRLVGIGCDFVWSGW